MMHGIHPLPQARPGDLGLCPLRLQRLPRPGHDNDQKAQLWLAPTLGYLPARIRLTQASGDFADLQLISHQAP